MSAISRRLAKLETKKGATFTPWLTIGRSDKDDEAQAIGFDGYPPRDPGEAWSAYSTRAQQWAKAQAAPPFVAHVLYRV